MYIIQVIGKVSMKNTINILLLKKKSRKDENERKREKTNKKFDPKGKKKTFRPIKKTQCF